MTRTRIWVGVTAVALLGVLATYFLAPLNGNIRYEAGVKEVGTSSAAGTFSHRPLAFRLLMDGVFRVARALSSDTASFEFGVRVLVAGMAVGAGVLLGQGLRAYGVRQPRLHAAVVVGVLLLVGPINAGEPDWMAVVLATGGAGVALLGRRRPWPWALLAGVLFVAAAGMKIVTLPTALLGLGVVALLDRRQLVRALIGSVLVGVLYVVVTVAWVPWEVQWLLDINAVQNSAVAGLETKALPSYALLTAHRPVLALLPVALVLAGGWERVVTMVALALTLVTVVAQGQYFHYHSIPLLAVAAVTLFRGLRRRMSTPTGVGVLVVVVAAAALTTADGRWLVNHERLWGGATVGVAVVALGWALAVRRRRPVSGRWGPLFAALATLALLYPGATPWAAHLLRAENQDGWRPPSTLQARSEHEATARTVHQVVGGPDVPVTYLTFGEWTYFVGNPTDCRYPSPLFLQRTHTREHVGTPSYQENLACLSAPGSRWLIWDPAWFRLKRTPPEVQASIAKEWNCETAINVGELRLCPRRG